MITGEALPPLFLCWPGQDLVQQSIQPVNDDDDF